MKKMIRILGKIILIIIVLVGIYILTLCFPQPFFEKKIKIGNITVYSDKQIPTEIIEIVRTAEKKIKKSTIYREDIKPKVFLANDFWRWIYFANIHYQVGGLAYVGIDNIFFRKVDIKANRLFGNSGKVASGDRTLDYFMAHEITHLLEFKSRPWYKYSISENWIQEGYCEYIGHDSQNYEASLKYYLEVPENTGAKRYTRLRTMVAYLLEKEKMNIADIWDKTNGYNSILLKAIPNGKPNIVN